MTGHRRSFGRFASASALLCSAFLSGEDAAVDSPVPPRRAHHALAFDARRGEVVLFGGSTAGPDETSTFFDDLWAWNGARWRRLADTGLPRSSHHLIFDPEHERLLLLGGFAGHAPEGDIRALEDDRWKLLDDDPALALAGPAICFDPRRRRIVLFGGRGTDRTPSAATWEHDGKEWSRVSETGPGPLESPVMAYDEARCVTLLVGGRRDSRTWNRATWQWDGSSWRVVAEDGPPPRLSAAFVHHPASGRTVLFGGLGERGMLGDTWLWDGTSWHEVDGAGPSARALCAMAHDPHRSVVVLFGGRIRYPEDSNDTWEWDGERWKEAE